MNRHEKNIDFYFSMSILMVFNPLIEFVCHMLPFAKCSHIVNERTISGSHPYGWVRMVVYLRVKFSIKITTALAK